MPTDHQYRQRARRAIYNAPPHQSQRNHPVLGYWVPLVVTATLGVGALAAWIWSERTEHDEEGHNDRPPRPPTGQGAPYPNQGARPYTGPGTGSAPGSGPHGSAPSFPPGGPPPSTAAHTQPMPPPVGAENAPGYENSGAAASYYDQARGEESGWYGQVRGVMKRTPSPQQIFDGASRHVTAGMAIAGSALGSILEDDDEKYPYSEGRDYEDERHSRRSRSRGHSRRESGRVEGFSDHERWSEEAEEKRRVGGSAAAATEGAAEVQAEIQRRVNSTARSGREGGSGSRSRPKRVVAVVVSADLGNLDAVDNSAIFTTEHASILSHLPTAHDPSEADLFVLIYAPHLTSLPSVDYQANAGTAPSVIGSSYSDINTPGVHTPAVTPGSELQSISPRISATDGVQKAFDSLYQQALSLVSHPSQILPFTTPTGYVQILKHLAPQTVYLTDSESLSGRNGDNVAQLRGWVGHTILVVGDEGHGGLADTETEDEAGHPEGRLRGHWYETSGMVGFGKDVEVVDAARVGDDWTRRITSKD
ncbi:hypothetical protein K431DRAFT_280983 [Polychaeton citri CBS 116435]|uniref:Uncharacterized protein n=1 Tax=Polychaeton citri CBS 116435 TaxID=1314669 RepID=A0A9P4UUD7_9PEZI|nr:hypothetical protein K431DRAFT_280983 [Polychaeton citri CBS 116435]